MNLSSDRSMNPHGASPLPADLALGDLDALLCAVKSRLQTLADGVEWPLAAGLEGHRLSDHRSGDHGWGGDADAHLRNGVLECVHALGQVHAMLALEIAHRCRLEQLVIDAAAVLALATPELVPGLGLTLRMTVPLPPQDRLEARAG